MWNYHIFNGLKFLIKIHPEFIENCFLTISESFKKELKLGYEKLLTLLMDLWVIMRIPNDVKPSNSILIFSQLSNEKPWEYFL